MERTKELQPPAETPRAGRLGKLEYKWLALSVTTIGAMMAAIDSTIVILALPDMMEKLHADLIEMVWVIMAYILISTVFLLTFGRVADMLGRVRMYNLGFVVFTIGSALCGISQSATQLILFRLVQGSGAALMMVNSPAIITEVFPPNERGRALGINGITWALGGIAGPLLGGLILTAADWRWIFYINVPIGILGSVWGYRALHEMSKRNVNERFDPVGALTFSLGLVSLLIALTLGIEYSWTSTPILSLFAVFVVMLIVFFAWERGAKHPVLDLSLFQNRVYNFSVLAAMLQALAMFAVDFLIVFYLQGVRGFDPLTAALLLLPLPIVTVVVGPLSGLLADLIGARIPATAGVLIQAAALVWFITQLSPTTPYVSLAIGLFLMGLGGGLFWSPNTSAAMNSAPLPRLGIASATLATLRQTGMVISFALALAVAAGSLPKQVMMQLFVGTNVTLGSVTMQAFVGGIQSAFAVSVVLCLVAAAFSLVRGKENRRAQVVPAPAGE
ncbi:MAG: MFS transporter [Chloroflexi bacterium]|nr:MFS transporter [Chloroflexota bacterium]